MRGTFGIFLKEFALAGLNSVSWSGKLLDAHTLCEKWNKQRLVKDFTISGIDPHRAFPHSRTHEMPLVLLHVLGCFLRKSDLGADCLCKSGSEPQVR